MKFSVLEVTNVKKDSDVVISSYWKYSIFTDHVVPGATRL